MPASTKAFQSFLGSVLFLLGALAIFFAVLLPSESKVELEPARTSDEQQAETKRQALRMQPLAPRSDWDEDLALVDAASRSPGTHAEAPEPGVVGGPLTDEGEDPDIQRAMDLVDSGQAHEAVQVLEALVKRDPRNEQALVELAMIQLLDLKQPELAVNYLQRVVEVNPQNLVVMSELVSLYEEQNRVDEGLAFLMDVQNRGVSSPELAHGVGQMLVLAGRDQEAIANFEKAAASPEHEIRAYRQLAEAYARSGEVDRATESYEKAIRSQEREIAEKAARGLPVTFPEERLAYTKRDLAEFLIETGDYQRAQTLLEEVSALMPGDETVATLQDVLRRRRPG